MACEARESLDKLVMRFKNSMGFVYDWCEERFSIQSIADDILAKFVPA